MGMNFSPHFQTVPEWIERASIVVEVFSVVIIVVGILYASVLILYRLVRHSQEDNYHAYKVILGKSLLLGLEVLVAADVIRTVALHPTLENVAVLGALVIVRTFLSWSLVVEIEGRWPWQPKHLAARNPSD